MRWKFWQKPPRARITQVPPSSPNYDTPSRETFIELQEAASRSGEDSPTLSQPKPLSPTPQEKIAANAAQQNKQN